MTAAATPLINLADLPENPAEDRAELDRQLTKLDRLGDLGLEIAEALAAQAKGTGPKVVEGDLALAYDRVARAVRMAVMLQSRLIEDRRRARDKAAAGPTALPAQPAAARKDQVARIIKRVAVAHPGLDGFQTAWCGSQARERLEHDDIYGQVMSQPVSDLVADICRDLGLTPNWARLAQEAWAMDEIDSGEVGEPLRGLLDAEAALEDEDGGPPDDAPSDDAIGIPTLHDRLQDLARDPAILAAAGRDSG